MSVPSTNASQRPRARVGDEKNQRVSFAKELDDGELLTGTPLVVEQTTSDLTITNIAVSIAQLTIKGVATAIGEAVQFHSTGFQSGVTYNILVTVVTDATPAQTINRLVTIVTD
jgi:hypothetical protein